MAFVKKEKRDPFEVKVEGVFGRFKTVDSYEVNYLLSNLPIKSLGVLQTAADAFDFDDIDFEEIMQRDVDFERVKDDIVDGYLKDSLSKAIFFPPIIVSVVALDDNGKPLKQYSYVDEKISECKEKFDRTWELNRFGIELMLSEDEQPNAISHEGKSLFYYNYASTLKVNPNKVKLVVIDGQHRFVALQQLLKSEPDHIENIELPVCFVFSPSAINGDHGEDAIRNFREMFVTINTQAKKVGGHFTTLLRDKSLSSITIRSLANTWKADGDEPTRSFLQMMEWNERNDNKSNQRMRPYSITTVGILNDVLSSNFFDKKSDCNSLLYLDSVSSELEERENCTRVRSISESTFDFEQIPVLTKQVHNYIVPALDHLFKYLEPYSNIWISYLNAIDYVDGEISKSTHGYYGLKNDVLSKFRRWNNLDDTSVRTAQDAFDSRFDADEESVFFFYNVFQHGLLRTWKKLTLSICSKYSLMPKDVAEMITVAFNSSVYPHGVKIFGKDKIFARHSLYQLNGKPNTTLSGKELWANLFSWSISSDKSIFEMRKHLLSSHPDVDIDGIIEEVLSESDNEKEKFLDRLKDNIQKYTMKSWQFGAFDQDDVERLHQLHGLLEKSPDAQEEIDSLIESMSGKLYSEARMSVMAAISL